MDSLATQFLLRTACDAFNNVNDKIVNTVCNGNAITNDLTGKIVCDVPTNGNVFLAATVWDVYTNRNVSRGLTLWDALMTENDFACIIVFFCTTVRISIFECSPVTHDLILPSMCARRAYPRRFLGHVGRTPYRRHSLGDSSERHRGKGLKPVCIAPTRTSGGFSREK